MIGIAINKGTFHITLPVIDVFLSIAWLECKPFE